jgi:hypothetical protein
MNDQEQREVFAQAAQIGRFRMQMKKEQRPRFSNRPQMPVFGADSKQRNMNTAVKRMPRQPKHTTDQEHPRGEHAPSPAAVPLDTDNKEGGGAGGKLRTTEASNGPASSVDVCRPTPAAAAAADTTTTAQQQYRLVSPDDPPVSSSSGWSGRGNVFRRPTLPLHLGGAGEDDFVSTLTGPMLSGQASSWHRAYWFETNQCYICGQFVPIFSQATCCRVPAHASCVQAFRQCYVCGAPSPSFVDSACLSRSYIGSGRSEGGVSLHAPGLIADDPESPPVQQQRGGVVGPSTQATDGGERHASRPFCCCCC